LPASLVDPRKNWQIPFRLLAKECGLPDDVKATFAGVEYFQEVLEGRTKR